MIRLTQDVGDFKEEAQINCILDSMQDYQKGCNGDLNIEVVQYFKGPNLFDLEWSVIQAMAYIIKHLKMNFLYVIQAMA